MVKLHEILPEMLTKTELLVLDPKDITPKDSHKDYFTYSDALIAEGRDYKSPQERELFNNTVLQQTGSRYLYGRYLEDRSFFLDGSFMAKEGRVLHLGIDLFCIEQEPVFAPCDGQIVVSGNEAVEHGYGNYLVLKPDDATLPYIFFGHLRADKYGIKHVEQGERIANLGHYNNLENGGWSIHLHLELLKELPKPDEAPIGYSTKRDLASNKILFPDPMSLYPDWKIKR